MTNRLRSTFVLLILGLLALPSWAQEETLKLRLFRDYGYESFGGDIQGTFTFRVRGPSNLVRVEFYLDEQKIGERTAAPFNLQFVTDKYEPGPHELHVLGYTNEGKVLRSNPEHRKFVSASEAGKGSGKVLVPLFAVIVGLLALSAVAPLLMSRKTVALAPGSPRKYTFGGGICPDCRRPFGLPLVALRVLASCLARCPYCGRFGLVPKASLQELHAAEQSELEAAKEQLPGATEEEKRRKAMDDSKYQAS